MTISTKSIIILFMILTFLSGFLVIFNNNLKHKSTEQSVKLSYPNILLRNGNKLSLLNTSSPQSQPMVFDKLEEYKIYQSQQDVSETTPIIYLREENNIQGIDVYKIYPSPFDCENGTHTMSFENRIVPKIKEQSVKSNIFNNCGYMSYNNTELTTGKL
jgi:hypothetical protein